MGRQVEIVDLVLAHVTTAVPGVTTRNALTEGFKTEAEISVYPWCEGFGVTAEVDPGDFGNSITTYSAQFQLLLDPDLGSLAWDYMNLIRGQLEIDYRLEVSPGVFTVRRVWVSASGVDEVTSRERTLLAFIVDSLVYE